MSFDNNFNEQQNQQQNRQIKLASRPHGAPTNDNFELAAGDIPTPMTSKCCYVLCIYHLTPTCADV